MAKQPYAGITGFMTYKEVFEVGQLIPRFSPDANDVLWAVGMLMSSKTLRGIQNKYPKKYPLRENLGQIFSDHEAAMNIIHYNTDTPDNLLYELLAMVGMYWDGALKGGGLINKSILHGFQLNVTWPAVETITDFKRLSTGSDYKSFKIILQVGARALQQVEHSPLMLGERLKLYDGIVDYVLLDPSGGLGKPMDVEAMHRYVHGIKAADLDIGIGIAGGLCQESLPSIGSLLEEFPDLSIDAEGRLRDETDNLDIDKARAYLQLARQMMYTHRIKNH
jgi:hypothetical protein